MRRHSYTVAGGIETGSITEIFGEFRTGKSQLCHMLAVTAQVLYQRVYEVALLITDIAADKHWRWRWQSAVHRYRKHLPTESYPVHCPKVSCKKDFGTCSSQHSRFSLDGEQTLDNIAYARAYNTDHQTSLLIQAACMMSQAR